MNARKHFDGNFMPHGHCFLWRSDLLTLQVVGDLLTVISYVLIPLGLIYIVGKRHDLSFETGYRRNTKLLSIVRQLGRYGGEEFLLLCPKMDKATAGHLAERMRGKVEALQVNFAQAVTVSIGVADCQDHLDLETLINGADQALYLAKNHGRNKSSES
jgi:hypothetical protein